MLTQHGYDGRFTLQIRIEGSADKADAKLQFDFDLSRNYGSHVISPVLSEAVNELCAAWASTRSIRPSS